MSERRILIAGNWKMNGLRADGLALARALAERARGAGGRDGAGGGAERGTPPVDWLVCPPATLIEAVVAAVAGSGMAVGGQDCHAAGSGAHTGDIAAPMLADLGCGYVIVGHSERRADHGEDDATVAAKAAAAHGAGLVAIVCVGESEAERDAGQAEAVVARQVLGSLPPSADAGNTVLAYEPVWAIGTGRTANASDVARMHAAIRARLPATMDRARCRVLYGGSVKPGNAAELLALADVDGALVGGASLDAASFWAIGAAAPS